MLFHMIYILYFRVYYLFIFKVDVQIFDGTDFFLESNGQKEFQIPLADRADQVLPLFVRFFLYFTSFKSYDFLKFVKNIPIAIL